MLPYKLNKLKRNLFLKSFLLSYKNGYGLPPPRYVLWDCTRKCFLNCVHCGATKEKYTKELTESEVKKLIDELTDMGVRTFAVTGGEPLTRNDLLDVLRYAAKKGLKTGIATNGFLINKNIAQKIKEYGINSVQISLDGTEEIHNKIRGNKDSFRKAIQAIEFLNQFGVADVSVATTATPLNLNSLEELKKLLINLKVKSWRITLVMPIGRAIDKPNLRFSKKELQDLFNFVIESKKKIHIEIGENLPFLADYDYKIRNSPIICPIGFMACCVGVDGHIRGCPEQPDIPKFREGSILEKSFKDIWKEGFKRYRNRQVLREDLRCSKCKNKNDCFGGCWVMREGDTQCIYDLLKN